MTMTISSESLTTRRYNHETVTETLQTLMRKSSLSEENKPLVLAGALLALSEERFRNEYASFPPLQLGIKALEAVRKYIATPGLCSDPVKRERLTSAYSPIVTHGGLHVVSGVEGTYFQQILNALMSSDALSNLDRDIIADFYRSKGDGKGLGIVLTPQHITELFSHLGFQDENTVFMDTSFGAGSFLTSALGVTLAGVDTQHHDKVRGSNVVGVELDPKMYALGSANMLIRGVNIDHLYEGSCFNPDIETAVTSLERVPTLALINPPYALKKTGGKAEIEFIENACNMVAKDGYVLALVPISVGSDTGAFAKSVKERILSKHTLYSVMSMPTDLFAGKAGTNVQVLVFKTGTPHSEKVTTWFADWRDDGFTVKKHVGRFDFNNRWEGIKAGWCADYVRRAKVPGSSTRCQVTAGDEWVTEAYLENDFTLLTAAHFEAKLKDFIIYTLTNDIALSGQNA